MPTEIVAWKEQSRRQVFKKYTHQIDEVIYELPNGETADFYIRGGGQIVSILALTPQQQIIIARQFRPGPHKILDELPGGGVDSGEDPLEAAKRELKEETGYEGRVEFIGTCLDGGYSMTKRFCYVATDCHKVAEPIQTPTEQIEVVLRSLDDFRKLLRSGMMTDVHMGYLGLDHLGLL
jgi:ADP-ribose pyrophosphatase